MERRFESRMGKTANAHCRVADLRRATGDLRRRDACAPDRMGGRGADLRSNPIEPIRTLLMDFGPEPFLGRHLAQILSGCSEQSFTITLAREVDWDVASAARSLSAKMDGDAPDLLFFTFERFPSDQVVAPLLGTTRRSGNGSVSIVVIQAGSWHWTALPTVCIS